ncbi:MAG: class I SAM-dependent methyltransferase [Candidatus Woesearchaeota archaeon]|nr:class I SAM-dependent methyltransferase [Candidatus Woesearchaeota archaeon]
MGNYNNFAEEYAEKTSQLETKSRAHYHSLLPSNLKNTKILDVGCGSGQDAVYYKEKGAEVYGVDISEREIEMAQKLNLGKFTVRDMNKLDYKSNTFDYVTSFYALQACNDVQQAILEMIRVVKPGGIILIQTKHPFRNLIEGWKNNDKLNYFIQGNVTSHILNRTITLDEPSHTVMEYLSLEILNQAKLLLFEEHSDFPASEQLIENLIYPTYIILKFKKK